MPSLFPQGWKTQPGLPAPIPAKVATCDLRELSLLAQRGLVAMFDEERRLFCHRLIWSDTGLLREGFSQRYSAIALLGLKELASTGVALCLDIHDSFKVLIQDTRWIQGIGDFGLLIWLTAAFEPERLAKVFRAFDIESALGRYADAQESRTMELSWFMAGLAHAADADPQLSSLLTDVSVETYHRLQENQSDCGLFSHMDARGSLAGRIRGYIGSFADQVYAVYAMSKFAKSFGVEEPLGPALECATAVCGAQGELGQWWWLYDVRGGHVCSHYPVQSVHQYGMAPMALSAIEETTGQHFDGFIQKGLRWIYGNNELGADLRDSSRGLIWRSVLPRGKQTKYWEMILSTVRQPIEALQNCRLRIEYEQRPYEFGWLLFALSKRAQADRLANPTNAHD